jgi:hypothetical protein
VRHQRTRRGGGAGADRAAQAASAAVPRAAGPEAAARRPVARAHGAPAHVVAPATGERRPRDGRGRRCSGWWSRSPISRCGRGSRAASTSPRRSHSWATEDFPLRGGAIGYFLDRKAAVFVDGHRMHTISLFVFRPEEFAWPTRRLRPRAGAAPTRRPRGGSPCSLWRAGELGYALVSDVDPPELFGLAIKLSGEA